MQNKKMVAPIVVTVCVILYYILYFGILMSLLEGALRYILGIFPVVFAIATIAVCRERIAEIKKGEEDDLSQY